MKTNDQIRRENLEILAKELGSKGNLADKIERSPAQLSQWMSASKHAESGKPRRISTDMARYIEKVCEKPVGWMDQEHDKSQLDESKKQQHPLIQNVIELMEKIDEDGKMAVLVAARSAAHARTMQIAEIEKMKREVADIQAVFDEFDTNEDNSALQQLKKRHTIPKS